MFTINSPDLYSGLLTRRRGFYIVVRLRRRPATNPNQAVAGTQCAAALLSVPFSRWTGSRAAPRLRLAGRGEHPGPGHGLATAHLASRDRRRRGGSEYQQTAGPSWAGFGRTALGLAALSPWWLAPRSAATRRGGRRLVECSSKPGELPLEIDLIGLYGALWRRSVRGVRGVPAPCLWRRPACLLYDAL